MYLRTSSEALGRRVGRTFVVRLPTRTTALLACALAAGCSSAAQDQIHATWTIAPARPVTAAVTSARVTLVDARQHPVHDARLRLEAQMSHPGMAPVIADMRERADGVYEADVRLSMAGDWVLVAAGELSNGTRVAWSQGLPNVGSTP